MKVEEQVASIFAGTKGFLDGLAVKDVNRYEREMMAALRDKGSDILDAIRTEKAISKDTEAKLIAFLEAFGKTFA
jgi:F-type H+-transporting ATPase subunit alpha